MKWLWLFLLGLVPVIAEDEIEGEVWYDSEGKVAFVDGPLAGDAKKRFVPAWERRAKEERPYFEFRYHHRYHRGWYGTPGWSVCRPVVTRPFRPWHPCPGPRWRGPVIIIR